MTANKDSTVDTKGAQELARLLEERHGVLPEPVPPPAVADLSAAPIYHWFGIEPPQPGAGPEKP